MSLLLTKYYTGDAANQNKIGRAWNTYGEKEKRRVWMGKKKEEDRMYELSVEWENIRMYL